MRIYMNRDIKRLIDCIKKSKSKTMHKAQNFTVYWYFKDVNQTGWVYSTLEDAVKTNRIKLTEISSDEIKLEVL